MSSNSKTKDQAERINNMIYSHNKNQGGVLLEITGAMGSGKTGALLWYLKKMARMFPEDKYFFSSAYKAPLQFLKLGKGNFNIMVKQGCNVTFHNRDKKGRQLRLGVTYFNTFEELYDKAVKGKCNAVFFGDRKEWMEFIDWLLSVNEWCHVFIDELGEVAPAFQPGEDWKMIGKFAETLTEVRKCMINVFYNTQALSDIDYRVRNKVMTKVFLPGAKADSKCRVVQKAIDNLNLNTVKGNQAWIEHAGSFGRIRFHWVFHPVKGLNWDARLPREQVDEPGYG